MNQRVYPGQFDYVNLFGTDLIDAVCLDAGMDTWQLLQQEDLDVIFPSGQIHRGHPANNSSFVRENRFHIKAADIEFTMVFRVHGPQEMIWLIDK